MSLLGCLGSGHKLQRLRKGPLELRKAKVTHVGGRGKTGERKGFIVVLICITLMGKDNLLKRKKAVFFPEMNIYKNFDEPVSNRESV